MLQCQTILSLLFAVPRVLQLQVNTVGFYQLSKICITPAALIVESAGNRKWPAKQEVAAIVALCIGVAQATVAERQMTTNLIGLGTAAAAVCLTVTYQVQLRLKSGLKPIHP